MTTEGEDDAYEKPKPPKRRAAQSTGEWTRELVSSSIGLIVQREQENDKKDARYQNILVIFAALGWLGFLVLGGHQIKTAIDAKNGTASFEANEKSEAAP